MHKPRKPGRPLGEVAQTIMSHLRAEGPCTARELAEGLQLSMKVVWDTCNRLVANGEIQVIDRRRVPGVNKRVSVYGACSPAPAKAGPAKLPTSFFLRL